jgi:hypothetical protein
MMLRLGMAHSWGIVFGFYFANKYTNVNGDNHCDDNEKVFRLHSIPSPKQAVQR